MIDSLEVEVLSNHAQQLTAGQDAAILDTLSAAYAEAGRFPRAIETEQQARVLATQQGKLPLANTEGPFDALQVQCAPARTAGPRVFLMCW
jgi:hypothetical protein